MKKKRIVITGGSGRFGKVINRDFDKKKYLIYFPTKTNLNILKINSIKKYLKSKKPNYLIHLAGLSRPMSLHDKNINKSIDLNIIGTANITKICSDLNIKLIYISTSYVYPGEKGNYKEVDPIKPINNYGLSKMGGEASVRMYKNSLVIRASMTEKPFIHTKAFFDFITNFIYHEDFVKLLFKVINKKGIINIGGKSQSVYHFAKSEKLKIKTISAKKLFNKTKKIDIGVNLSKLNKIIKKVKN